MEFKKCNYGGETQTKMKFTFKAKIYKVGINPCVKVPLAITDKMETVRGYIPVRGKINDHAFQQTLVSVKNEEFRLYVNGPMLKGSGTSLGDTVTFRIEQDPTPRTVKSYPMPAALKKRLLTAKLMAEFKALKPYKQKEILKYLDYLKTEEARERNMDKVVRELGQKNKF